MFWHRYTYVSQCIFKTLVYSCAVPFTYHKFLKNTYLHWTMMCQQTCPEPHFLNFATYLLESEIYSTFSSRYSSAFIFDLASIKKTRRIHVQIWNAYTHTQMYIYLYIYAYVFVLCIRVYVMVILYTIKKKLLLPTYSSTYICMQISRNIMLIYFFWKSNQLIQIIDYGALKIVMQ